MYLFSVSMKKTDERKVDEFIITLAKSVDALRSEVAQLRSEIKTPLVVKEKEAQLTVSSIWSTIPTQEQKVALHNHIAELMKLYGILQANIQYVKENIN